MFSFFISSFFFHTPCVENMQMFGSIHKINNVYYQLSGFTSVVYDESVKDDIYIKDGRVRVRSCGRYLEYRARPLVNHCTNCGS